jgi:hypothetical protein
MPDEVWPTNCSWQAAVPLDWYRPEPSALYPFPEPPFWRRSEASILWADWCHQNFSDNSVVRRRVWPAREPRLPSGLAIVLSKTGSWDYSLNVFRDGRILFQSNRCAAPVRTRQLSAIQVDSLIAACRAARLGERKPCTSESSDIGWLTLAFIEAGVRRIVQVDEGCAAADAIAPLVRLIVRTAGSGTWVP